MFCYALYSRWGLKLCKWPSNLHLYTHTHTHSHTHTHTHTHTHIYIYIYIYIYTQTQREREREREMVGADWYIDRNHWMLDWNKEGIAKY